MMPLYEIIRLLQNTQGTNNKLAILQANKDNDILQTYLKAVYDPSVNYYQKKLPKHDNTGVDSFENIAPHVFSALDALSSRLVTGHAAVRHLNQVLSSLNKQGQELLGYIIQHDIRAGIAEAQILKVWPSLWQAIPYQRCSLLDDKARKRFEKLEEFLIQPKHDSSFAYILKYDNGNVDVLTRAGSKYPSDFSQKFSKHIPKGAVLCGEVEIHNTGVPLSRKEGNGILNSILQGNHTFDDVNIVFVAWDFLSIEDFYKGKSTKTYKDRFKLLQEILNGNEFI